MSGLATHSPIPRWKPWVLFKDKWQTGLNRKDLFMVGLIPVALGGVAFVGDMITVLGIKPTVPFENAFTTLLIILGVLSLPLAREGEGINDEMCQCAM